MASSHETAASGAPAPGTSPKVAPYGGSSQNVNDPTPKKDGSPNHPLKDGSPNSPKKNYQAGRPGFQGGQKTGG